METTNIKIIRKPEVISLIGLSNASIYRLINENLIPPPFSLGCRAVGWYEHEIKAVIKARAAGRTEEEIKSLVTEQLQARQLAA